ncbi:MAG: acyltransferase domain-containing protein [Acidimicrobiales bacterium]
MNDADATVARMRAFLPAAPRASLERVRHFETRRLVETLEWLTIASDDVAQVAQHWDAFRHDEEWVSLLAALLTQVELQRGTIDAPLPIWPDLDGAGPSGRLFFVYLFALAYEGAREYFVAEGTPEDVIDRTFDVLARHCATHRRKWGTFGVDAGWWMLPVLRGELVQVGSLQFHLVTLGVGSLSPTPWYDERVAATLGAGFRRGDVSIGVHIPQGADLSPRRLDDTMENARRDLGRLWPTSQRRLATCATWMLDERLRTFLDPSSNIVQFQQRFNVLSEYVDDDEDVLDFVFRSPGTVLGDLAQETTLQRGVVDVLSHGGHWHTCTGWIDFDGS